MNEENQNHTVNEETAEAENPSPEAEETIPSDEEQAGCGCESSEDDARENPADAAPQDCKQNRKHGCCSGKKKLPCPGMMHRMLECLRRPVIRTKMDIDCDLMMDNNKKESDDSVMGCHFHSKYTFPLLHVVAAMLAFAGVCGLLTALLTGGKDDD